MLKNTIALVLVFVPWFVVTSAAQERASKPALTTQDYIDIQQLIARYAVAIDECTNNGYDYAALYADDGWFSASRDGKPGRKWQGRESLAAAARGDMKTCDEVPWKGIKHMYVNHVITPTAEGATGRIDLIAIGLDGDPHKVEHQGHYEDVYVKTSRGWLFKSRLHVLSPGQAEVSSGQKPPQRPAPVCKVEPSWPTVPDNWIFSAMAGIATDSKDNVWIIHRAAGVTMKKACCKAAPIVMQFDPSGRLLQSWEAAPGTGYEWPLPNNEHGIFIDYKDNVWIAGRGANGTSENQLLKFDSHGKFLLQIGHRGRGTGSNDTANLGQPADMAVYQPTNEVFVADGYGNRRIIVFDADTGAYKRHWGAYGNKPDDAAPRTTSNQGPGDPQFNQVHHVRISRDGFVYVADRLNRRIQVFTIEGKFVKEAFVRRASPEAAGTVSSLAFSAGPDQRYLYVADQAEDVILVLDRQTLAEVGSCGRLGRQAGQFVSPHNIATDSRGNLYVAEDLGGSRLQKFVFTQSLP